MLPSAEVLDPIHRTDWHRSSTLRYVVCIRDVLGSKLGWDIFCRDWGFWFSYSLPRDKYWAIVSFMSRSLPSEFSPVHQSPAVVTALQDILQGKQNECGWYVTWARMRASGHVMRLGVTSIYPAIFISIIILSLSPVFMTLIIHVSLFLLHILNTGQAEARPVSREKYELKSSLGNEFLRYIFRRCQYVDCVASNGSMIDEAVVS